MFVYLVRHGEAIPKEVDPARPLSENGRAEVEATARELLAEGAKVDEIWHSGKLRAKQTAEIIGRVLGVARVIEQKGLKPDDDPAPIAELLRQASSGDRTTPNAPQGILIAGHLPFISKLVQLLKPEMGQIELRSGGAIKVSL